jgi:hypothetical protein
MRVWPMALQAGAGKHRVGEHALQPSEFARTAWLDEPPRLELAGFGTLPPDSS